MELEDSQNIEGIEKLKRYSEYVSETLIYLFMDFLSFKKIKFMVAPYEADSQLVYLYLNKDIDYVMSEDSDLIVLGCTEILRQFKMSDKIKHFSFSHLSKNSSEMEQMFVKMGTFIRSRNTNESLHNDRL